MEDLNFYNYTITDNLADADHGREYSPDIAPLANEIYNDIKSIAPGILKKLFKLIKEYPGEPVFRNQLTIYYREIGEIEKAYTENKKINEDFPDYVFARINVANEYLETGQIHKVEEVLGRELEIGHLYPNRHVFHIGEILGFNHTVIRYLIATKEFDLADNRIDLFKKLLVEFEDIPEVQIQSLYDDLKFAKIRAGVPVEGIPVPKLINPLILELYCNSMRIHADVIKKILELPRQSLLTDLTVILRNCKLNFEEWEKSEDDLRITEHPIHALFLIVELKDESSLPLLLEILGWPEKILDFWFNDFLTSDFWKIIYKIVNNQTPELLSFILKPNIAYYSRTVISQVMKHIAILHPKRRDEVVKWFRQLLSEINTSAACLDNKKNVPAAIYLSDLADIKEVALEQEMALTHKLYLSEHDAMFGGLDKMLTSIHKKNKTKKPADPFPDIYTVYENCLSDWYYYFAGEDLDQQAQIRSGEKDIDEDTEDNFDWDNDDVKNELQSSTFFSTPVPGRNDPCTCGSGKKYKKCCLLN